MSTEYWVILEIVNAANGEVLYAGNIDEIVSVSLTGMSEHERYGYEQGLKNFHDLGMEDLTVDLFSGFYGEHGWRTYCVDFANPNHLRMKLSEDFDDEAQMLEWFLPWVNRIKEVTITGNEPYGDRPRLEMKISKVMLETVVNSTSRREI